MGMASKIIGRENEIRILENFLASNRPEFLAIYGRRRIGKTFLIRSYFENKDVIFLNTTGAKDGPLLEQISNFTKKIGDVFYNGAKLKAGKNWNETFEILTDAIKSKLAADKKVVLFFDEFPWMATKNSRLLQNLDYYWNQYWSADSKIKLIICGSSASWIKDKIVNNKGGLHNRLTQRIPLEPFDLKNTKAYLNSLGIKLNSEQILPIYMVTGGVPYYLSQIEKGFSASQNIERLAFRRNSFLLEEFDNLFSSLFDDHEMNVEFVRAIADSRYGIGQEELLRKMGTALHGESGMKKLRALQDANFIIGFKPHFHSKKGMYYKVIDEYTLFYFHWIEPIRKTLLERGLTKGYWDKKYKSAGWDSWSGYAYEAICYKHIAQISKALDLSPTAIPSTWRYAPKKGSKESGAQIDLLFDRDDDAITICEIKYTDESFSITKAYAEKFKNKIDVFNRVTRNKKQIFLVFVSANGLKDTINSEGLVDGVVTLKDLFQGVD